MQEKNVLKPHKKIYVPLIFSLLFLFNPNISVIDLLPDFIGYFILARIFTRASDSAPFFEEARIAFRRLGWLNFCKIFGLFAIVAVKRQNYSDNDSITLVTFVFAVCEVILMINATTNIFDALFHIGQRTDATATVAPFKLSKRISVNPDSMRSFTYFFSIFKCATYFLPTIFLLSRINPSGTAYLKVTKLFPIILVGSHLLGIVVGIVWLIFIIKYAASIHREGLFYSGLDQILSNSVGTSLEHKEKMRSIFFALSSFTVASFFTIELKLVESYDVNLLPHFLFALVMLFSLRHLSKHIGGAKIGYVFGALYAVSSLITYVFETRFLIEYGYEKLLSSEAARRAYPIISILSGIEFCFLCAFLICIYLSFKRFYKTHTGIINDTAVMNRNDDYYGAIAKKNTIALITGIIAGAVKTLSVILHGAVKVVFSDPNDVTRPTIIAPAVEWIGLFSAICTFLYIGAMMYFISTLKDEVKMRYEITK